MLVSHPLEKADQRRRSTSTQRRKRVGRYHPQENADHPQLRGALAVPEIHPAKEEGSRSIDVREQHQRNPDDEDKVHEKLDHHPFQHYKKLLNLRGSKPS
jgi:hypothetical protein